MNPCLPLSQSVGRLISRFIARTRQLEWPGRRQRQSGGWSGWPRGDQALTVRPGLPFRPHSKTFNSKRPTTSTHHNVSSVRQGSLCCPVHAQGRPSPAIPGGPAYLLQPLQAGHSWRRQHFSPRHARLCRQGQVGRMEEGRGKELRRRQAGVR